MFCDEFHLVDLRVFDNCKKVVTGCDHVFNLAADMGGMGFIQSNHSVIFYNNTMISFNMIEAARQAKIERCGGLPVRLSHVLLRHSGLTALPQLKPMRLQLSGIGKSVGVCALAVGTPPKLWETTAGGSSHLHSAQVLLRIQRMHLPRGQAAQHHGGGRRPEGV